MTVLTDNSHMSDRKSVAWALSSAMLMLSALVGLGMMLTARITGDRHWVAWGFYVTLPAAIIAVGVVITALMILSFRCWDFMVRRAGYRPREEGAEGDVYISTDEIVGQKNAEADLTTAVPLEPMPLVRKPIKVAFSRMYDSARWYRFLPQLQTVAAEHRLFAEFTNKSCFRLGVPRDRESWKANGEWLYEFGPDMVSDKHLKYVILDLANVDDIARRRVISYLAYLLPSVAPVAAERVRVVNVPSGLMIEMERFNVKVHSVDATWMEQQRNPGESVVVSDPAA